MAKRPPKETPKRDDSEDIAPQPPADDDGDWGEISLEELGQAYAEAMAEAIGGEEPADDTDEHGEGGRSESEQIESSETLEDDAESVSSSQADDDDDDAIPTPAAIIEAALFIGNPENRGITESELAALMRDVTAEDVSEYVDRLNESYMAHGQAFRIHRDEDGLRLGVAPDMEIVRRAFYGKIRETRLSQPAIEVLSLVAYQPGITGEKVQDQRGKESASLLSQLVRRRLLEQRRVAVDGSKKTIATYHPTERFLQLFGLQSLDDLPQVEG